MKKHIILLTTIFFSACSIIPKTTPYNPDFLIPIDAKLFDVKETAFIFFASESRVLVNSKIDPQANGWYELADPSYPDESSAVFYLRGWGNYNGNYIGVSIKNDNNNFSILPSIQPYREFAENAVKDAAQYCSFFPEIPTISTAMYIASTIQTWVKTSRAGIFNTKDTTYMHFKRTSDDPLDNSHGELYTEDPNDLTANTTNNISFLTNVSPTKAIYMYNLPTTVVMLGITIDLKNPVPRANFITNHVSPGDVSKELKPMSEELDKNIRWEYGVLSAVDTSDGILPSLGTQKWNKILNSSGEYNPQNSELWDIDSDGNTATLHRTGVGTVHTDFYIMEKTTESGIYRLIDNKDLINAKYHGCYFGFKKIDAENATFFIAPSISAVKEKQQNDAGINLRVFNKTVALPIKINSSESGTIGVNWGTSGSANIGRSGLGAVLSKNKIYIIGGYTNSFVLPSVKPRYATGKTDLPKIYNAVYTLENLDQSLNNIKFQNTGQSLTAPEIAGPYIEQAQAITVNINGNDTIYVYGGGSLSEENFYYNNLATIGGWQSYLQASPPILDRYHGTFYSLEDKIYILGGTINTGTPTDMSTPASPGTFTNDIWYTTRSSSGASWTKLIDAASWTPRTSARVFTIEDRIILVGGYINNAGTITGTNDVWESLDKGKTWKVINTGGTPGTTTTAGAPPVANSENAGMLAGVAYGSILFMVDPANRDIYYSINGGIDWKKSATGFPGGSRPIYGAQIIGYNNYLYLLGGQTSLNAAGNQATEENMEKNISRIKINFSK